MHPVPTSCGSKGAATTPTSILSAEHRVIERVLDALVAMSEAVAESGTIDTDSARGAVEFLRTFADRCHHGKEEDRLFPAMEARAGWPEGMGPTQVMRDEHVEGRGHIAAMAAAVDKNDAPGFCGAARAYNALLREHIMKEDQVLFPMADGMLADQYDAMLESFRAFEHEDLGEGTHGRMLDLARTLCAKYGVEPPEAKECGCGH